ncbi:MAG: PD-(D/E)XK nuclease family protein, partial [Clostridia bacterium]|nr:PD-(D/E)XK nuclease family protein [Clostridia bacterium]
KDTFVALSPEELRGRVDFWMADYAERELGGLEDKTTRFQYLYDRLKLTLYDVSERLQDELRLSDFVPADFELPIGGEETAVPSYDLELPDGGTLSVRGYVDRVDLCEKDGKTYVRVVDYKSGGKEFELSDVLYGLNLQMLLYLFTIRQNGTGKYSDVVPAGILYYPAKRTAGSVERREASPDEATLDNKGRNGQNGLLLNDPDILEAMEHGLQGNYLPVKVKRDLSVGPEKSLATLEELGRLQQRIDFLLRKMASDLHQGRIAACPAQQNDHLPCEYCDYTAVCRPEEPTVRLIESLSREELLAQLETEVTDDGSTA